MKALIDKADKFVKNLKNLQWRTFFFLNPNIGKPTKETYGFNSTKSPPSLPPPPPPTHTHTPTPFPELKGFEEGLEEPMTENIKFREVNNNFQSTEA